MDIILAEKKSTIHPTWILPYHAEIKITSYINKYNIPLILISNHSKN